jgi:hypothetical protein
MAEDTFALTYEGPALAEGRMPVRQLAPALSGFGELFTEASRALYPERPPAQLEVVATEEGSFDVQFILSAAEAAWDTTEQIFGSDGASALANLIEIVAGACGVLALIKRLGGRPLEFAEDDSPAGKRPVALEGETVEFPDEVLELHQRVWVRRSAREVVRPLGREGVERLKVRRDQQITVTIDREDLPAFDAIEQLPGGEAVEYSERETVLHIDSIAWKPGNKWRVSEGSGGGSFWATITDPAFLEGIEKAAESFVKGDMLRCRLRVRQSLEGTKLRVEYEIVDVIEHIKAGVQLRLGAAESGDAD